jgi:2-polyprenyl-3-methyl-5-hydroxy-6-metoxy-1,4-benzoquinol methylase
MRYEHRGVFPAARCPRCDMRFLVVQPAPAALAELYGPAYFERDFRCGRSDAEYFSEDAFRAENRDLLDAFAALAPPPADLLEVGCAGGWLLKHATERGWRVRGVELSAAAVAHARGLGLDVHHGELAEAACPAGAFDLVYMGDVLEHVPDCRATLEEVARVLRPGGHLYLRGPITTNSLARRLALGVYGAFGRTIVLREPPYHLWEFTPRSLSAACAAAGLEVIERRQTKIPPGRVHGEKSPLQRVVMFVLDVLNVPLTRIFNACGDRIVLIARR